MKAGEICVRGIVAAAAAQGEYGRRLTLITDRLGKITVFASGAAKQKSGFIGAVRPFSCADFTLARGRSAYNLRSVAVIDAFPELAPEPEQLFLGMYVLETALFYSEEGMPEEEAKRLLNLVYVTLSAIRENALPLSLVRHIYELRLLKLQGEYTEFPPGSDGNADGAAQIWQYCLKSPVSMLYDSKRYLPLLTGGRDADNTLSAFEEKAEALFRRISGRSFRTRLMLEDTPENEGGFSAATDI